jgi:hypothetical protein
MGMVFRVYAQVKKVIEVAALSKNLVYINAFGQFFAAIFTSRIQITVDDKVIVQPCEHFRRSCSASLALVISPLPSSSRISLQQGPPLPNRQR